ncbi:MAG TPA: sulfatase-like hydrolase/transferase [Armatimonadota bacterium]|nr:sulfatase-like hydrolase/transferase [Armatimonadota bacterium]
MRQRLAPLVDFFCDPGIDRAYGRFPEGQVRSMLSAYYGQITLLDAQIGRVMASLDASGRRENTMIVFTSDHGDYLGNNWPFYRYGAPYDSLSRMPFILSWPGRVESGTRRHALTSLIDLAPTFLQAAGATPVDPVDGVPLQPLLEGGDHDWREDLFVGDGNVQALITPEWRYVRWNDGFEALQPPARSP